MSVIISPPVNIKTFINLPTQIYMSTIYALVSTQVFIEYKNPTLLSNGSQITGFITDFGEGSLVYSDPMDKVYYSYSTPGTYYVSTSAILYSTTDQTSSYFISSSRAPFVIENTWKTFNANEIRYAKDIILNFPYSLNQIEIQPNEWGVKDIFNTSINRLQDNLDYLIYNTQILNTHTPTEYIGWLGSSSHNSGGGIRWNTQTYNYSYLNNAGASTAQGSSYFTNLKDSLETSNLIYVLDGTNFRAFSSLAIPEEIIFSNASNINSLLIEPSSFDSNNSGDTVYIADPPKNTIYKLNVNTQNKDINIQLFTGGFGGQLDHDKFNSPTQLCYVNDNVFVLDYNNKCVKQYNNNLNWIYTYHHDDFDKDQPISVAVNSNNSDVYILTKSAKVYIFNTLNNISYTHFIASDIIDGSSLNKIIFDNDGYFFYILTDNNIYKYSYSNEFVNKLNIPNDPLIGYNSINRSTNKSLLITSNHSILKIQDILETFHLGKGLPYNYWSKDQLQVSEDELSSDINYNRSLLRMAQNLKTFRDTLNAQMVLVKALVSYISWIPIKISDQPILHSDIENETLGVGINELHVPSVFNKELAKLYSSLTNLLLFLNINNAMPEIECTGQFCWSWKALSTYNISYPVVRTCDMNPISYMELLSALPISYAPTKTWGEATSDCCN